MKLISLREPPYLTFPFSLRHPCGTELSHQSHSEAETGGTTLQPAGSDVRYFVMLALQYFFFFLECCRCCSHRCHRIGFAASDEAHGESAPRRTTRIDRGVVRVLKHSHIEIGDSQVDLRTDLVHAANVKIIAETSMVLQLKLEPKLEVRTYMRQCCVLQCIASHQKKKQQCEIRTRPAYHSTK